jgi:hypothetical protein
LEDEDAVGVKNQTGHNGKGTIMCTVFVRPQQPDRLLVKLMEKFNTADPIYLRGFDVLFSCRVVGGVLQLDGPQSDATKTVEQVVLRSSNGDRIRTILLLRGQALKR